jgi:hypothetical protein
MYTFRIPWEDGKAARTAAKVDFCGPVWKHGSKLHTGVMLKINEKGIYRERLEKQLSTDRTTIVNTKLFCGKER